MSWVIFNIVASHRLLRPADIKERGFGETASRRRRRSARSAVPHIVRRLRFAKANREARLTETARTVGQTQAKQQELRLAEAIATNNLVRAKKLLNQGVDPNVRLVGQNCEPLIFLGFEKSWFTLPLGIGDRSQTSYRITAKEECLRLLLEYGADPNVRNSSGRSVMEIAIIWCLPQTVKLLLLYGANPNARDKYNLTPLMKTAILGVKDARPTQNKLQIVMYLLDGGAEIDAQAPDGKTALMHAVGNARIEIVELLISNGASLTIMDREGNKAQDIISQNMTQQQQADFHQILTQPELKLIKHKYRQFLPEGDRLLSSLINHQQS